MYDSSLKAKWDYENSIAFAEELAEKRGIEIGVEEGIEIGVEQGIEIGVEQGEYKKSIEVATEMKKEGIPDAQIAKYTKLPIAVIEKL